MLKRTWAEVSLDALQHNYQVLTKDLPEGCRFAERCPYATERCNASSPEAYEIEPGHFVKCHTPGIGNEKGAKA